MSHRTPRLIVVASLALAQFAAAQSGPSSTPSSPGTSIAARTAGFERVDGFVPLHVDTHRGRLYAELPRETMRALFWVSEATRLGSNPIGLDRGASGAEQVVRFARDGDRVLMTFENTGFRTSLDDAAHRRSVEEAFPPSTVASLPVLADEGNRLLVDATDVAYRDWNDVVGTLARANNGTYSVARDRSFIDRAHTRSYPTNTEIDVALTYVAAGRPGDPL